MRDHRRGIQAQVGTVGQREREDIRAAWLEVRIRRRFPVIGIIIVMVLVISREGIKRVGIGIETERQSVNEDTPQAGVTVEARLDGAR